MHKYSLLERFLFLSCHINKEKLIRSLEGKTVFITGASSGIGEQLSYLLSPANVHLILVARRGDKLLEMKERIEKGRARVSTCAADLRNDGELEDLLLFIQGLPHGIDIFVSNAGKSIRRRIYDSLDRYHDFTRTMAVNYFAPVKLLLSLIPILEKNRGQIINISTVNALLIPIPHWAAYQASKSAFDVWLRSASPELNARGMAVTSLYLPLVKTPMIKPTKAYDRMPAMSPEHVARLIAKSMYTRRKKYTPWWIIFGQLASVLFRGIWEALIPRSLRRKGK